ncbi:hypothetical protein M0804_014305 [Polistes exclamans]|nr:hypothetical protein M0804_014305 [Polistes exclamans]
MRRALPEAKIARPQRTSPIRLVGVYLTTTLTAIRCGLQEVRAGFDPNLISMGEVHLGRGSRYEVTVLAPSALCQAAIDRGSILVGWSSVRVFPVRPRPLRCHRCLARGHVAASCPAPGVRRGVCFRCREPGHVAKDFEDKPRCPICVAAGRSRTSHRAGTWECTLVPPTKGRDIILEGVADRQGKSGCAKNVPGSAGEKTTVVQGAVHSAGLNVDYDMEVEQVSSTPPCY